MAFGIIDTSILTAIAGAIRTKLGVQTTYRPSEMAAAILSIGAEENNSGGSGGETAIWSGNLVNPSDISYSASHIAYDVPVEFLGDGDYYPNPRTQMWLRFYDSNDNNLVLTNTDEPENTSELSDDGKRLGFNYSHLTVVGTQLTVFTYPTQARFESQTNPTVRHYQAGGNIDKITAQIKQGEDSTSVGLTYGSYSSTYVPYTGGVA